MVLRCYSFLLGFTLFLLNGALFLLWLHLHHHIIQRIEPVDLFFSYPLHELDAGGILREANLEENERSMENGREIRHVQQAVKKANIKERLYDAINRDEEVGGKRKTQKEYAEEFGVSERTIRTYLREMEEDI